MATTAHPSILVVDDNCDLTKLYRVILESRGYRVRVARDGTSALLEVSQEPPDLMILDLLLPDMDGFEVCRRVRDHFELPIIAVSGLGDESYRDRVLEMGMDDYLTKPVRRDQLLACIQGL